MKFGYFSITIFTLVSLSNISFAKDKLKKVAVRGVEVTRGLENFVRPWSNSKTAPDAVVTGYEGSSMITSDGRKLDSTTAQISVASFGSDNKYFRKFKSLIEDYAQREKNQAFTAPNVTTPNEIEYHQRLAATVDPEHTRVWIDRGGGPSLDTSVDFIMRGLIATGEIEKTNSSVLLPYLIGVSQAPSFHGSTESVWIFSEDKRFQQRESWAGPKPVVKVVAPIELDDPTGEKSIQQTYENIDKIRRDKDQGMVKVVIITAAPGTNGLARYPKGYLAKLTSMLRNEFGIRVIMDEVYAGVGATGQNDDLTDQDQPLFWAHQREGINPDNVTAIVGAKKIFGGEYPGSVSLFNGKDPAIQIWEDKGICRGDTYRSHFSAYNVGLAALDMYLSDNSALLRRADKIGRIQDEVMSSLPSDIQTVTEWKPNGTIGNIDFRHPVSGEMLTPEQIALAKTTFNDHNLSGFFRPGGTTTTLNYVLSDDEARKFLMRIRSAIEDFDYRLRRNK